MTRTHTTAELIAKAKAKIWDTLDNEDYTDPETGLVTPAIQPRDLAALGNLIISLSKHEEDIKAKKGPTNSVVAFPALPAVQKATPANMENPDNLDVGAA